MLARGDSETLFDFMQFRDLVQATENKYNRLLASLIFIYVAAPFLVNSPLGSLIVSSSFLGAIIVVVYQTQHSKEALRLNIGLALLALLLEGLSYLPSASLSFSRLSEVCHTVLLSAFLSFSVLLILRELTAAKQVTADLIKGGLCVYLLCGFFWTAMYNIVYSFDANAFRAAFAPLTRADLNHFSFTTLTTVGYGDIFPISKIARVLANLEGMLGVMYPAVFIARLVSLYSDR